MFSGFFAVDKNKYKDPVLVASCDGVGTKLLLAVEQKKFDTIGIDLVAMCVNDVIVHGAEPLFFLDYIACGSLKTLDSVALMTGMAKGCEDARCAILGGETAEMPGLYAGKKFDLAGFTVGVAERSKIIDGSGVRVGAAIIGIASSGLHSNGYSLVRKIVADNDLPLNKPASGMSENLGDVLLTPTRIYVRSVLHLQERVELLAGAHITGGGLIENLPRVLPKSAKAIIDFDSWSKPPIFSVMQHYGKLPDYEMLRVFNCGIGFVVVVPEAQAAEALQILKEQGERAWVIGVIEARKDDEKPLIIRRGGETLF
jgi:phosphoribosylformylglycinamidine cyclo-ligase